MVGLRLRERSIMDTDQRPGETAGNFISAIGMTATGVSVVLACINRKGPVAVAVLANGSFAVSLLSVEDRGYAETFSGRPRSGKPLVSCNRAFRRIANH